VNASVVFMTEPFGRNGRVTFRCRRKPGRCEVFKAFAGAERQSLRYVVPMTNGYQANDLRHAIDSINDLKASRNGVDEDGLIRTNFLVFSCVQPYKHAISRCLAGVSDC
jgi:hypothetical protein